MKKTKIVCTLGPSTDKEDILKKLMLGGMNVARLYFSHGSHAEHKKRIDTVKKLRNELNLPIAILLDTKGPEIRIGSFSVGKIHLKKGQRFTLTTRPICGDANIVSVSYKGLPALLRPGDTILADDGLIALRVEETTDTDIFCIVQNDGNLSDNKSINLPNIAIDMPYMTERDRGDILFGIAEDVDFIAASFVRCADDVRQVRQLLSEHSGDNIKIIAKIENAEGIANADAILQEANGIMIARGDMGVEVAMEQLPDIQKKLIKKCYFSGKMVITATQMLDSMITEPRPTRAEVTDVANAIYDGTSAIMLSGETAAGKYPLESLATMVKIAESTEANIHYDKRFLRESVRTATVTDAVGHAACTVALDLASKAIVTVTKSGHTARMISKFRPSCPILAATTDKKVYHQLALSWGVLPMMNEIQNSADALFSSAIQKTVSCNLVATGDTIVITGSSAVGHAGKTNMILVHQVA